jgi:hypothetical protein
MNPLSVNGPKRAEFGEQRRILDGYRGAAAFLSAFPKYDMKLKNMTFCIYFVIPW